MLDLKAPHALTEPNRVLSMAEFQEFMSESLASAICPRHPTYSDVQLVIDTGRRLGKIPNAAVLSVVYKWESAYVIFILEAEIEVVQCDCENCVAERKANKPTIH